MDFDVIVIGSGIGGLTSAARLATLGYKVGVFEKHFLAGGYATNFKRKGYEFDVSLHGIGGLQEGGNPYRILKHCGVLDKIVPLKNEMAYQVMWKDKLVSIPNDLAQYKQLLIEMFPNEAQNIDKLFKAIQSFADGFDRFILNENSSIFNKMHPNVALFMNWSGKTTEEVVKKYVKDEEFITFFTVLWTYYGLPPKQLSALYFFIPWISYHHHGKFYIKGGGQALSDACVEVIKENNGAVYLKSEVEKIHVENNVATGITLKNGQQYRAKSIISNINPSDTHRFLPQDSLDTKYEEKLLNSLVGCTLSQLYIGLKCHPKQLQIPEDEVFFLGGNSHEEDYELALNNEYEKSGFLLTNYNTLDSTLNDENKGVLTVTYLDNYEYWSTKKETYKQQKQEVTDKILKRLDVLYPNFIENVEVLELGTPRTMERYTKNSKGAVYGYAQTVDQAGRHRLKSKTSIQNLWLVGAYVNPGGGYEGSISSGMVAAQALHRFLNMKKA